MPQDYAASVQGVAIRVTRLDESGNLLNGPSDSYTTSAFIRTSFTPEYEEGDEITEKAADGTVCVSFKAPDTLKRVNLEIAICNPDPELSALMSGGLMLSGRSRKANVGDADKPEIVQGWASAQVGEDPSGNGVAVEVWSRAIQNGKPASENPFFRWVFPYVKTRLSGDRVIENGLLATTFEGFGLGNINFRTGIDTTWRWPAAVDRPYLYAREAWAPLGLNGFYQWSDPKIKGGGLAATDPTYWEGNEDPVPQDLTATNNARVNVRGAGNPYPYTSTHDEDFILNSADFVVSVADIPASATGPVADWPASAASQNVLNKPSDNAVNAAKNPVVYLTRNDPVLLDDATIINTHDVDLSGQVFRAIAKPDDFAELSLIAPQGASGPLGAFPSGDYVVLGDNTHAFWDGTAWATGEAPPPPAGATGPAGPPAVVSVTAGAPGTFNPLGSTPASYAALQGDPVVGDAVYTGAAWTGGQNVVLGDASTAYWDGTAWQQGVAP